MAHVTRLGAYQERRAERQPELCRELNELLEGTKEGQPVKASESVSEWTIGGCVMGLRVR